MITSKADRTCFCRGIALVFHLHTSSPLCPFTMLCAGISSASAQKQEQCSPAHLLLSSVLKVPKKQKRSSKTSPKLPNLSTSFPAIHCRVSFTSSRRGQAVLVLAQRDQCSGRPQPVPRAPKGSGEPCLLPGHLGGSAAPKTA